MNDLVQPVSELKPAPIGWLWHNNLSFGNLALFDGDPGLGKSLVALDLCARLSSGRPFPSAEGALEPASAVILNGEDGPADAVLARLTALGANLDRIHVLRRDFFEKHAGFRLPHHTRTLEDALADTGARLLVIDPIMAFLDRSVNVANDQSVRAALVPLLDVAARHQCVPLLIRHLNKTDGTHSIYRGGGSIAFQGACRSSWLFARDPVHKERSIMAQVKNNYAVVQPALAYEIQTRGDTVALSWLGTSTLSANQLLAAAGRRAHLPEKVELAGEFLLGFLKDGPRPTTEIWPAAQKLGFSRSTVHRARRRFALKKIRTWTGKKLLSYWLLPGQRLPDEAAERVVPDLQKLLQPIIDRYPTTPLDAA
jgi:hypothetical protein